MSQCVTFPPCSNSPDVRAAGSSWGRSHSRPPRLLSCSEQPGPLQVLLTANQEEEEDQATPTLDAAVGQDPPTPPCRRSIRRPCDPGSPRGEEEEGGGGEEGVGVRLCELLQVGGVSVRPLGRHLAISLPSLPLRLWDRDTSPGPPTPPPPPHPSSPPPPPPASSLDSSGQRRPFMPLWQPPRPHSANVADSGGATCHWSSWSLDRPDAVVMPYHTAPDCCLPICPSPPGQRWEREEAELSELDSLYRASLLAGRTGTHTHTHPEPQTLLQHRGHDVGVRNQ